MYGFWRGKGERGVGPGDPPDFYMEVNMSRKMFIVKPLSVGLGGGGGNNQSLGFVGVSPGYLLILHATWSMG